MAKSPSQPLDRTLHPHCLEPVTLRKATLSYFYYSCLFWRAAFYKLSLSSDPEVEADRGESADLRSCTKRGGPKGACFGGELSQ